MANNNNQPSFGEDLDFLFAAIKHKMEKFDNDTRSSKFYQSGIIEGWHIHKEYLESLKKKQQ